MILFADNFQQYASLSNMLNGVYAQAANSYNGSDPPSLATDPDPLAGGNQVLRFSASGASTGEQFHSMVRYVLPAEQATVGTAFRLWMDRLPSVQDETFIITFRDANNISQCFICVTTTGAIAAYRGAPNPVSSQTLLGQTSIPVLPSNAWNHVEVKVNIHDTAGTVQVYVNGILRLNLSSLDTKATSLTTCAQIGYQSSHYLHTKIYATLKDLVVWDTTGSQNNDFIGDVNVYTLRPSADSTLNWTPSTGATGYNLIDDTTTDDTDYISTSTATDSVFELTDVPGSYVAIKALVTFARMSKSDGGAANVQVGLQSGATEDTGTNWPVTTAATYWYDVSELDPNTSTAWTPTSTNAAKIRLNRTA